MLTSNSQKPLILCLFAVIGALAYNNILDDYFLSDDFDQIGKVLEGNLSFIWWRSHGGFFRPLFILSYYLDSKFWGTNPLGFHLTNLLIHVLNSFLVFALTDRIIQYSGLTVARQKHLAPLAGLLFLLHPSHTEAVSWVSGRADLLATLFCLASLLSYVAYLLTERLLYLPLALCAFLLALISKEAAICLPLVILVAGIYFNRGQERVGVTRRVIKTVAPFIFILAGYIALRALVLGVVIGGYGEGRHLIFTHSIIISQVLRFAIRAVFPAVALQSLPFLESRKLSPILIAVGAVVVLATAAILMRGRTRRAALDFARRHSFLWLMSMLFFCSLIPVINLRINVFDTQGERYLYLPSVFSSVSLAYLLLKATRESALVITLVLALLSFYVVTLRATNRNWSEAARLSRRFADEIANSSTGDTLIMLNVPDNLRGAYLFRNGIEQALGTFRGSGMMRRTHVVAFHDLQTPQDQIELFEKSGVFTLRPLSQGTALGNVNPPTKCLEVLSYSKEVLQFRLTACEETPDIVFFSAGRVFRLKSLQQ